MNLSVQGGEYDLALDLGKCFCLWMPNKMSDDLLTQFCQLVGEMLESPEYCNDKAVLSATVLVLQKIARDALPAENSPNSESDDLILRKIFNQFEKMATSKSRACRESIDVSAELYALLKKCQNGGPDPSEEELSFVKLLAHHGAPGLVLQTLAMWAPDHRSATYLIPLLHIVLQRGTQHGIRREISGSLLRIRYARAQTQGRQSEAVNFRRAESPVAGEDSVWRRMFDGSVTIAK